MRFTHAPEGVLAMTRSDRAAVLHVLYPIPDPFDTLEQYQRAIHADLPRFTRAELAAEARQVRLRLEVSTEQDGRAWLEQRLAAVAQALHA